MSEALVIPALGVNVPWTEVEETDRAGRRRIGRGYRVSFTIGSAANELVALVLPVNGSQKFHEQALQEPVFAPGRALRLRPEPDNPYDSNAVMVWDAEGQYHVGYVPAEQAAIISAGIRDGKSYDARVIWEWLTLDGQRTHLRMLISDAPGA